MNPLLMVWNLQEVAVKPFVMFSYENINAFEFPGRCGEAICNLFLKKY